MTTAPPRPKIRVSSPAVFGDARVAMRIPFAVSSRSTSTMGTAFRWRGAMKGFRGGDPILFLKPGPAARSHHQAPGRHHGGHHDDNNPPDHKQPPPAPLSSPGE